MGYAILIALLYAHAAEYLIHRFVMHRPWMGRVWWYTDHTVEHHARGRLDINVDLSPVTVILVASPLLVCCLWVPWQWWVMIVFVSAGLYADLWTALHRAHHGIEVGVGLRFILKLPCYAYWKNHHLRHHTQPSRNFGTVFPWTDWLMWTRAA